jgi:uncharacterized protein (TIGR03000 family)
MRSAARFLAIVSLVLLFASSAPAQTSKNPQPTMPTVPNPNVNLNLLNPYVYWLIHHRTPYPVPYPVPMSPSNVVVNNYYAPSPGAGMGMQSGMQAQYPQTTAVLPQPSSNYGVVAINLPTTAAVVWVDGQKLESGLSATRVYTTGILETGHDYQYTIKAQWVVRGDNVSEERAVQVAAGKVSVVDFTKKGDSAKSVGLSGY